MKQLEFLRKRRNWLTVVFFVLLSSLIYTAFNYPHLYENIQLWFNFYDHRNKELLDALRGLNVLMIVITLWNFADAIAEADYVGEKAILTGMSIPVMISFLYFAVQLIGGADVYPRNGFVMMNVISIWIFLGYSYVLGSGEW